MVKRFWDLKCWYQKAHKHILIVEWSKDLNNSISILCDHPQYIPNLNFFKSDEFFFI